MTGDLPSPHPVCRYMLLNTPHCIIMLLIIIYLSLHVYRRRGSRLVSANENHSTNTGHVFGKAEIVFGLCCATIRYGTRAIDICLLTSNISWTSSLNRMGNCSCVAKHVTSRRSGRTYKTFANFNSLSPCISCLCVVNIPTVLEPSTAACATASFSGFFGNSTLGTLGAACNHRYIFYHGTLCGGNAGRNVTQKGTNTIGFPELTFARLYALDPCMIEVSVASITTVLEPCAVASATR